MVATQSVNRKTLLSNDVLVVLDIIDETLKPASPKKVFVLIIRECQLLFVEAGQYTFLKINIYYCAGKVRSFITKQ